MAVTRAVALFGRLLLPLPIATADVVAIAAVVAIVAIVATAIVALLLLLLPLLLQDTESTVTWYRIS